ncbi:MAG: hypothetical protein R6V58_05530 [Planctomycetota bacterium]
MTRSTCIAVALVLAATPAYAVRPSGEEKSEEAEKQETQAKNPIRKIAEMMKAVGIDLGKLKAGDLTREQQEAIIEAQKKLLEEQDHITEEQQAILKKLEELIKMAQKAESSSQPQQRRKQRPSDKNHHNRQPQNASGRGSAPMRQERDVFRNVRPGHGRGAPDDREKWGELSPMMKDRGFRALADKLPAKYRELLQRYFRVTGQDR